MPVECLINANGIFFIKPEVCPLPLDIALLNSVTYETIKTVVKTRMEIITAKIHIRNIFSLPKARCFKHYSE